jgi:hypothetical protein
VARGRVTGRRPRALDLRLPRPSSLKSSITALQVGRIIRSHPSRPPKGGFGDLGRVTSHQRAVEFAQEGLFVQMAVYDPHLRSAECSSKHRCGSKCAQPQRDSAGTRGMGIQSDQALPRSAGRRGRDGFGRRFSGSSQRNTLAGINQVVVGIRSPGRGGHELRIETPIRSGDPTRRRRARGILARDRLEVGESRQSRRSSQYCDPNTRVTGSSGLHCQQRGAPWE